MKSLQIEIFTELHTCIGKIIAQHAELTDNGTRSNITFFEITKFFQTELCCPMWYPPDDITHYNFFEGVLTLYYDSGYEIEVRRIND
jgi:hypothetical protein